MDICNDRHPVGQRTRWIVNEECVGIHMLNMGIYDNLFEAIGRAFTLADQELINNYELNLTHIDKLEADAGYSLCLLTTDSAGCNKNYINYYIMEVIDYIY